MSMSNSRAIEPSSVRVSDPGTGSLDAARDMDDDDGDQACRMIRTSKLNALPRVHTWPINVVVYHDPQGNLVSR